MQLAAALACVLALLLGGSSVALASPSPSVYRAVRLCETSRPGAASCGGIRLVARSLTGAALKADAARQSQEAASGASPAVTNKSPLSGGLTPQNLHAAYALPPETFISPAQTIAVVDAYNDPTAEADLAVYDKQFGLPACTTANGCFRKIDQQGKTSPLPATQGGWVTEISLDVQMAHAICQNCHVLLVEANNEAFSSLGTAVNAAVSAGATEISNSYGGAEESYVTEANAAYNHAGIVITVSTGDCGYLDEACGSSGTPNFPADSPDVVAVGGTALSQSGESWTSTVWEDGGSGCSNVFSAPLWQTEVESFSATGCAGKRSSADVAADADPYTGVDVYDSTPSGQGYPTGWGIWGGTSASSPIVASEFGLAGGAHGVSYPAQTLYAHLGDGHALTDVVSGHNGSCASATSCKAAAGFDGPTGVGSPLGLGAFAPAGSPIDTSLPTISGTAEQAQTLSASDGEWSASPTSFSGQWLQCNASGSSCSAIAKATGATYTLPAGAVGSTIRVQQIAKNGAGSGSPALSAPTATVISDAPTISSFTPSTGVTGSSVTITGTALTGATKVHFGSLIASFTVLSSTQIKATVPDGAIAGDITVNTPTGSGASATQFTPTLSLSSLSPASASSGQVVTITGVGFNSGSTVSFDGTPAASVTFVSATKLKATVPGEAGSGTVSVSNSSTPVGTVSSAKSFTVK
ncbi:MAG TPA: IPT/TIG domain-containing protein [Solirubrobacteraceae bacterium]|nr:IPT/TIG domain-containing protein [Solirubrobacteraceae bacterium]